MRIFRRLIDFILFAKAWLRNRNDIIDALRAQLESEREKWRRENAILRSEIAIRDREIKSLALLLKRHDEHIQSQIAVYQRTIADHTTAGHDQR